MPIHGAAMKIEACLTDDIARTLLIPLWCCATPCRANPRAAYDPVAVDVLKQLDFDFSEIRRSFKEYGQVCCLAREMNIDRTVRKEPSPTWAAASAPPSTASPRPRLSGMMWTCRKSSGPGRRSCRLPKGTGSWHGTFSIPSGRMPWRPRGNGASSFWQPECSTISPRT